MRVDHLNLILDYIQDNWILVQYIALASSAALESFFNTKLTKKNNNLIFKLSDLSEYMSSLFYSIPYRVTGIV